MNVQVIADAFGRLLWVSPALPGAVHDIKAARTHGIIEALTRAGIRTWADIYLTEPQARVKSARTYPCDPVDVDGMINLDFDEQGRLIGIEVLEASSKLPEYLLQSAKRLDIEGA